MENKELYELVSNEFNKWIERQQMLGWKPEISEGAVEAICQMIINIKKDPSSSWRNIDAIKTQKYTITLIPNILNDLFLNHRNNFRPLALKKITSWEIWHGISNVLDSWCPIPKDF